ncbi:MAG: hypothetical protein ACC655_11855 [Rhodothermia bacterium]
MKSLHALSLFIFAIIAFGCTDRQKADDEAKSAAQSPVSSNIVEVVSRGFSFEAPSEIPSGWTTFRYRNESAATHFVLLDRMPDGKGVAEQQSEVAPVFQDGMNLLNAGEVEAAIARFGELPEWFAQIVFMGGPGLTAPGQTSETTVYLEPGTYVMECYVKTNGIFHSYNPNPSQYGMVLEFTVTSEASNAPEPTADLNITLSSARGIEIEGEVTPGEHTVSVYFEDQVVHENFVEQDDHLVRISEDTDLEELGTWINWMNPTGLETPAPGEFLGGTNELPAGSTAYFTVNLEPGYYAWISEVANPTQKGMLKAFTVGL